MSAIGDYIHATSLGYHGFKQKKGEPSKSPYRNSLKIHQMIEQRMNKLETWNANTIISPNVKSQLEKEIQNCLDLIKGLQGKSEIDYNEENKLAIAMLQDIFDSKDFSIGLEKVNKEVLFETNALQGSSGFIAGQQAYYESEQGQKEIENAVNQLIQSAEDVLKTATTKDLTLEKINTKIEKVKEQKEIFLNSLVFSGYQNTKRNKALQQYTNSYLLELRKLIQSSKKSFNKGTGKQLEKIIKIFINSIKKHNVASNYSGDIGEGLAKIIAPHMNTLAEGKVNKEIKSSIVGRNPSQRVVANLAIKEDLVDPNLLLQLINKKYTLVNDKNLIVTANSAPEKIDVEIYAVGNKKEGIFASVKNYSTDDLTKVSFESKNIISLLDNENRDNLINHYLNLNTIYYTGHEQSDWNADKNKINQYIKKLLIQKLISGKGTQIRDKKGNIKEMHSVNIFITINSDNFTVKIYNMGDLLNSLQNNNKYIDQDGLLPELQIIRNPLIAYPDAKTRITNILAPLMSKSTTLTVDMNDVKV